MNENQIFSLIGILIGLALIIFRKKIIQMNLKGEYQNATSVDLKIRRDAEKSGISKYLLKIEEVAIVIGGIFFFVSGLKDLFWPAGGIILNRVMSLVVLFFVLLSISGGIILLFLFALTKTSRLDREEQNYKHSAIEEVCQKISLRTILILLFSFVIVHGFLMVITKSLLDKLP